MKLQLIRIIWNPDRERRTAVMKENGKGRKYTEIRKLTDNRFLNLYEIDALDNRGLPFHYYFASRNQEDKLPFKTGETAQNGIVIYALLKEEPSKIVMIRQYRYPLDDYVYELPAGLIDAGETAKEAAVREMREETGLLFEPCTGVDPAYERPYFLGAGMTDETSTSVFGYASGTVNREFMESTESIEVYVADKEEAKRILQKERVSLRAAFLLIQFIHGDDRDPFAFLR